MANGMSDLFQNKLFLQYLAGAGADISAGQPIGQNVNAVTNQAITAQNFTKMLARMMGSPDGKFPTGGKVTMDEKGMKMDIPSSNLGNLSLAQEGAKLPGGSGINWTLENMPQRFNPFR